MRHLLILPVVAWLVLAAAPARAALHWLPEDEGLDAAQRVASARLLDAAQSRLPARWRQALGEVPVHWRSDLPPRLAGHAAADGRIVLPVALLAPWQAGAATTPAAQAQGLAAVLHELAHLLDRSPAGGFSRDPRLLDLAGWQHGPLRLGLRQRRTAFTDRSPDRYELASPREYVAVNLEHDLLDADYACRRPLLAAYFDARIGAPPLQRASCPAQVPFFQQDADAPVTMIDPARVYAVDYLLAEGNGQPLSHWGHSMLRLVICAPGRPPGPDCRLDLADHRVLSFRAFVDDVQISSWRGLTGDYPSRLYLLPLDQVLDEYTRVQLRGLRSVPLRLAPEEIATLLQRAGQVHWSYDGRYRFISNNCAVETWKLLHDGVPRLQGVPPSSITPTGLLARLQHAGIADASALDDPDRAGREGYLFPAATAHDQQLYAIAQAQLALPAADVQAWLALDPRARRPWLDRGDLRAGAALLVLEVAAGRQLEQQARDALKRRWPAIRRSAQGRELAADLDGLFAGQAGFARPAGLLAGPAGYGLPQAAELAGLRARAADWLRDDDARRQALFAQVRPWIPATLRERLQASAENQRRLGQRLRDAAATGVPAHAP